VFLGMHMANELLTIPVAVWTLVLAAIAVAWAARQAGQDADSDRIPLTGVMGAFVFAAQMINFTLPGMPGTSGHLGGGVLLAILLGPARAILCMAAILIVQCLMFQDGGLLALGCNIINMGVIPCLLGLGVYRLLLGPANRARAWRQYLAAWGACIVALPAGAAMVPLEAGLAGVLRIPIGAFLAVMVGVHLLIGLVEGAITFAVIAYVRQVRPALVGAVSHAEGRERLKRFPVIVSLIVTALLLAGVASWFTSTHPDGLEWSYVARSYGQTGGGVENTSAQVAAADRWQSKWSLMTDYSKRAAPLGKEPVGQHGSAEGAAAETAWPNVTGWTSLAGVLGTCLTLGVVYGIARVTRRYPRNDRPAGN